MASKRRLRRKRCTNKKVYHDRAEAAHEAARLRRRSGEHIQEYACGNHWHCGHWKR